jgi:hypothetical protein
MEVTDAQVTSQVSVFVWHLYLSGTCICLAPVFVWHLYLSGTCVGPFPLTSDID